MKPFWKNEKYQAEKKYPKEEIIVELKNFMEPFPVSMLPSFSSLKQVFGDLKRKSIVDRIKQKTEKRRRRFWEHNKFDKKLIKIIDSKEKPEELEYWVGVFLEFYKAIKSENKND